MIGGKITAKKYFLHLFFLGDRQKAHSTTFLIHFVSASNYNGTKKQKTTKSLILSNSSITLFFFLLCDRWLILHELDECLIRNKFRVKIDLGNQESK